MREQYFRPTAVRDKFDLKATSLSADKFSKLSLFKIKKETGRCRNRMQSAQIEALGRDKLGTPD
jgi:hypothetical protein